MRAQKGLALILVLWVLSLLTIMAGSFVLSIRRETAVITGLKNNAEAMAIAESGIAIAESMLLNPESNKHWRADGSIYQIDMDTARLRIRILSETGKININNAEPALLQNLLSHAPNGAERKLSFGTINRAAALLDWRDNDDLTRINGAEKKQYQDAGLNYQPRNKNFQTLEELQMVLGMDEATLNWLEPLITVYSPSSAVNLHLATKEVLQLLLRLDVKIIEQYVTARANSVKNNLLPPLLPIGSSIAESSETSILDVVTIICEAQLNDASTAVVSVLVKKSEGLQNMPFEQLKWQRFTANNASLFATNMNELVVKHYAESELNN